MPPKIRELKSELRRAGFVMRIGKGSHTVWMHPDLPDVQLTLSGHDGDDAHRYQERDVRDILARLHKRQRELS